VRGARADAGERGRELVDRLGLRDVADSPPSRLSGGEQQRFAIARALVNDPALVLADEPTGNLDVEAGAEVLRLLRAGAADGRAVVLVTHEPAAAGIADRVLTLRDGKLVA
jgi:ABC-type lipoprotein export system ATPase subunit